jgi:hypothetical protein
MSAPQHSLTWTPSSAEGRWCGFGPYYAMFPVDFVRQVIEQYCPNGGRVLDPFCGRGTTPYVATITGRHALATDINPVAWVYTAVKLNPCKRADLLMTRVDEILDCVRAADRIPDNEFQKAAWHKDVLGFLNAARRILNWRKGRIDRTLMGIILVYLHAKRGGGLSNQLRQSKAMAPNYSVQWWRRHGLRPPRIDVRSFFESRVHWRYAKGIPVKTGIAHAELGDAREILSRVERFGADFLLTSPPYCGVTNYEYDNWIRLWMLGGPALPSHRQASRYSDKEAYQNLLYEVFAQAKRLSKNSATIYVRTDAREYTLATTMDVLTELWPRHRMSIKLDRAKGRTQTALFHDSWPKSGEVDILLTSRKKNVPRAFYNE